MLTDDEIEALLRKTQTEGYPHDVRALVHAVQVAERERWRLRVLGLQANYDDPACRAALKHAAAYGSQDEA